MVTTRPPLTVTVHRAPVRGSVAKVCARTYRRNRSISAGCSATAVVSLGCWTANASRSNRQLRPAGHLLGAGIEQDRGGAQRVRFGAPRKQRGQRRGGR